MQSSMLEKLLRQSAQAGDLDGIVHAAKRLVLQTDPEDGERLSAIHQFILDALTGGHFAGPIQLSRAASVAALVLAMPIGRVTRAIDRTVDGNSVLPGILTIFPATWNRAEKLIEANPTSGRLRKGLEKANAAPDRGPLSGGDKAPKRLVSMAKALRKSGDAGRLPTCFELIGYAEQTPPKQRTRARAELYRYFAELDHGALDPVTDTDLSLMITAQLKPSPLIRAFDSEQKSLDRFFRWLLRYPAAHSQLRDLLRRTDKKFVPDRALAAALCGDLEKYPYGPSILGAAHFFSNGTEELQLWHDALSETARGAEHEWLSLDIETIENWLARRKGSRPQTPAELETTDKNIARPWTELTRSARDVCEEIQGLAMLVPAAVELSQNGAHRHALVASRLTPELDAHGRLEFAKNYRMLGFEAIAASIVRADVRSSRPAAILYGLALAGRARPRARIALWRDLAALHDHPVILRHLVSALVDGLEYEEADAVLDELDTRFPDRPHILRHRTLMLARRGDLKASAERAEALVQSFPDDLTLQGDAFRQRLEGGQIESTAEHLTAAFEGHKPNMVRALADLAMKRRDAEPVKSMRQMIAEESQEPGHFHGVLNATFAAGDFTEGRRLCGKLKERFPGYMPFWKKAGQVAERQADYEAALDNYTEAIALAPEDPSLRSGLARSLIYLDREDDALDWLALCGGGGDRNVWPLALRAFLHARHGAEERATRELDTLYRRCARIMAEYAEGQQHDPRDTFLLDGSHIPHPSPHAAEIYQNFNAWWQSLTEGSVTLVGNSPSLLESGRGADIDQSDTVIRLNDFTLTGYEDDIGRKTTHWYTSANRQAAPDPASVGEARVMMMQPHAQHFPDVRRFSKGRLDFELDPSRTAYLAPCVKMMSEALCYPHPSTGFRVILMLEFLAQIRFTAMGFSFFQHGELHYFDTESSKLQVGEVHATDFERDFVDLLLAPHGRHGQFR